MTLKRLVKRGAILAAANWQVVVIQFVAETTFHALLAVPLVGAAILVAVMLGADIAKLLQGSVQQIFQDITHALMSEPAALIAFITAFGVVLIGGSVLMFLVKGGTVDVILAAAAAAGPIEDEPLGQGLLHEASRFTVERFVSGCQRLFRRYLALGLLLMLMYAASGLAFVAFLVFGYQAAEGRSLVIGWTFAAALAGIALVVWITIVNLVYLLLQIVVAAEDVGLRDAARIVLRLIRVSFRELCAVLLVMLLVIAGATFAAALAWSGVGLIAFVPLIGLAVIPLQLGALLLRGLAFEYIGLTAVGVYATLHARASSASQSPS